MKKAKESGFVVVERVFARDDRGRILIGRRSLTDHNNPGLWEAFGGKVKPGEAPILEAEREVLEESGFIVKVRKGLSYNDSYIIQKGKYAGWTYTATFRVGQIITGTLKLSREHTDVRFITYKELFALALTRETRDAAIELKSFLVH